jgi:hypothetical protein
MLTRLTAVFKAGVEGDSAVIGTDLLGRTCSCLASTAVSLYALLDTLNLPHRTYVVWPCFLRASH